MVFDDEHFVKLSIHAQIPTLDIWAEAASVAYKVFLGDEAVPKQRQLMTFFNNAFNAPIRFSEARCKKVLPLAFAAYQEGLPTHYTKAYHEGRVVIRNQEI